MKRRAFLRLLGIAPVVAAVPAIATTKPDNPKRLAAGGSVRSTRPMVMGEHPSEHPFTFERGELVVNPAHLRSRDGKMVIDMSGGVASIQIKV